ncbi:MAG: ribosome maturation factor RimM [Alphaproteobacteria bacterium]
MDTTEAARQLRQNQTEAKKLIWKHLRDRQLSGYKFRRQHPLPPYIADFFCEEKNLIIEIDGGQHTSETDKKRSSVLEPQGYQIIRFWNNEVLANIEGVLETILLELKKTPHPNPLPKGEGIKRVCLGKIIGVHGVKGLVKILPFGEDVTLLDKLLLYTHEQGDEKIALSLKNIVGQYQLAAIKGVNDRTEAEKIRGTEFWVDKSALPKIKEKNTYYHIDLIGLPVLDETGAEIGVLTNVLNYGSTDLFDLRLNAGGSCVIPFTPRYVAGVEIGKGITVTPAIKDFSEL